MAEKISGIYKIECLVNGKVYIGQSINIKQRWGAHLSNLKNNRHDNIRLQRAYNKYGKDNFIFEIIEECNTNLDDVEKYWICYFDSFNNGFNLTEGGKAIVKEAIKKSKEKRTGKKISEDTKRKIGMAIKSGYENGSISRNHDWAKGSGNVKSTPIYQFDARTLKILKKFDCVEDAEREMKTNGGVSNCIRKINIQCKGYYWQKVDDTIDDKYIGKIKSSISHKAKKINQIDANTGEIIHTFNSIKEANMCLNKGKESGGISSCLRGITKKSCGYKWEYV